MKIRNILSHNLITFFEETIEFNKVELDDKQ